MVSKTNAFRKYRKEQTQLKHVDYREIRYDDQVLTWHCACRLKVKEKNKNGNDKGRN